MRGNYEGKRVQDLRDLFSVCQTGFIRDLGSAGEVWRINCGW